MGNWARVPAESRKTVWVWQNVVVTAIRRCHCKAFFSSFAFTTLRDTFTVKTFRFPSRPALTWPEFTIATPQWVPRGRNRLREQSRSGGILVWKWRPVYSSENKNLTLKGDQSGRGWDPLKETLFQPSILAFVVKMSWIFFSHTSLNDTFKAKNINFPSGRPKLRPTSLFVFILKQPPSLSPPPHGKACEVEIRRERLAVPISPRHFAPRGFAAYSRVLARLASLAQKGKLARRLLAISP